MTPEALAALIGAAKVADWEQVRLNGGPPCFRIEDGRFCLRAQRWQGHGVMHEFTTLDAALAALRGQTQREQDPKCHVCGHREHRIGRCDVAIGITDDGDDAMWFVLLRQKLIFCADPTHWMPLPSPPSSPIK